MWSQQISEESTHCFDSSEKNCLDSAAGDSGFLSSSNCISFSSEFSSNSMIEDSDIMKSTDSGIDSGLSNSFNQLSLKQTSLNRINGSKTCLEPISEGKSVSIDSGRVSMTTSLDKQEEICQEPWQLYFTQNEDGDTLLHTAIIQGYFEATLSLISAAPHPCLFDILNDDAQTALHLSVITNQPKIVRKLVIAGADLSIRNYQGNTALHLACISGNLACAKALTDPITTFEKSLVSGRQPSVPQNLDQLNYHGQTSLHVAASNGHVDLVQQLLQAGADLEAQESLAGRTALHLALEHGQLNVVLFLVQECRPHLDAATYSGCTAYEIACCVNEQLADELVRLGATPPAQEASGFPRAPFAAATAQQAFA